MTTKREQVLGALLTLLAGAAPGVTLKRNEPEPARIPAGGYAELRDGEAGDPEILLSPLTYLYTHRAELEIAVQAGTGREAALDAILAAFGTAIEAGRTLGGLCDWIEPDAPQIDDEAIDGGTSVRRALVPILLTYASPSPLG